MVADHHGVTSVDWLREVHAEREKEMDRVEAETEGETGQVRS